MFERGELDILDLESLVSDAEYFIRAQQYQEELLVAFDLTAEEQNRSTDNPWEKVRISKSLAVYDPAADRSAESVFDRADAAMYEDKKRRRLA